MLKKFLACNYH